jgi:AcrR family transcriptional regulator
MARQDERRKATSGAIFDAAYRLFGERGFARTTVDAIAAEAGVAKGAVFHYHPSKHALFEAVLDHCCAEVGRMVKARAREAPDPLAALDWGNRAYFTACAAPRRARIILKDGPAVLGWARWRQIDERHFGRQVPLSIDAAMRGGLIAPRAVEPLARILLGAMTEAAVACSESADPAIAGAHYADALHLLIEGLRLPAG